MGRRKTSDELSRSFKRHAIESAVAHGLLDPSGMTDDQFQEEVARFLKQIAKGYQLHVVIDYRNELLRLARDFRAKGRDEISCMFFATWLEHTVNDMVRTYSDRKGLRESVITNLIREVPIRGKVSWLLILLDAPAISKNHQKAILKVAELRNYFVHYKFVPTGDWHQPAHRLKDVRHQIEAVEKTVRYLQRYINKNLLAGKKMQIRRITT